MLIDKIIKSIKNTRNTEKGIKMEELKYEPNISEKEIVKEEEMILQEDYKQNDKQDNNEKDNIEFELTKEYFKDCVKTLNDEMYHLDYVMKKLDEKADKIEKIIEKIKVLDDDYFMQKNMKSCLYAIAIFQNSMYKFLEAKKEIEELKTLMN